MAGHTSIHINIGVARARPPRERGRKHNAFLYDARFVANMDRYRSDGKFSPLNSELLSRSLFLFSRILVHIELKKDAGHAPIFTTEQSATNQDGFVSILTNLT